MKPKKEISLLPEDIDLNSTSSRILRWVTTVGRVVIIVTELIVIGAFLSRFYLDRKNADLSEIIRQQKAILDSTQNFENEFTDIQTKLTTIKKVYSATPDYDVKIQNLVSSTPLDIKYERLTVKKSDNGQISADISLFAYQEESIVNFITNLILNPETDSVNVKSIQKNSKENFYRVSISLTFKKEVNK